MKRAAAVRILLGCAVLAMSAGVAFAGTFNFSSAGATGACAPAGTTTVSSIGNNGLSVNGLATITTNNGSITVTLTNCTTGEISVAQNISDVFFTVSGASTGTVGNATANYIDISGTGTITADVAGGQWGLCSGGGTFHLDDLGCGATGTPADTIVGTADCTQAASICGNAPHNPFINHTATWTITAAGVTTSSTVSNVTISWGTLDFPGTSTPEPGTLFLFGTGLVGVAGLIRRKIVS